MFVSRTLTLTPSQRACPGLSRCSNERLQKASDALRSGSLETKCHSAPSDVRRLSSVSDGSSSGDSVIIVGAGIAGATAMTRPNRVMCTCHPVYSVAARAAAGTGWTDAIAGLPPHGLADMFCTGSGLCLAAALKRIEIPYYVLEQRGELSREGAAIGLWGNAFQALEQIGVHSNRSVGCHMVASASE